MADRKSDGTDVPAGAQSRVQEILRSTVDRIDGAQHAAMWIAVGDVLTVYATTEPSIDAAEAGLETPTLKAHRDHRIVRVPTVERNTEFPEYCARCRTVGVSSVAAIPFGTDSEAGVLTMTSADHHGFAADDLRLGRTVAAELAALRGLPEMAKG